MLQYLILNNRLESAKVYNHVSNLTWKEVLLSSFSKGHREAFFSVFQLLKKQQKLEFYLRVYFLIYSIHPALNQNHKNGAIPQKEINSFREFLDTKGADLAKTSEFLEFYALPFIKKPLEHATFKTLFTKTWVSNLKEKLNSYIQIEEQSMKQSAKTLFSHQQPTIQKPQSILSQRQNSPSPAFTQPQPITTKPSSLYQQKFLSLQKTNQQLFNELQQIKERYQSLQQNHQSMIENFNDYMMESQNKWFQSYKQLVKTAKGLLHIVGQQVGDNPKLQRRYLQAKKKIDKYERFVNRKLEDLLSVSQDISVFDKPSMNEISQYTMKSGYTSKSWITQMDKNLSHNNNNITSYVQIDEYIPTNFYKLNQDFLKLPEEDQWMVIEGFCWRLIKAKSRQVRRMYCVGMVSGNFVGLGKVDAKDKGGLLEICTRFLSNRRFSLKVLQLLNYIKSDYFSRQHLFLTHNITFTLMQLMAQSLQESDLQSFSICLDIISTISVYKDYRQSILQSQLPIFLLNILESYPKIFEAEELMELIMMTLMNFSSCDEGLEMFEQYENVFSLLSGVFEQQSHDIMMLVNGFYYTLLASKRLYEIALESNMVEFVKYLLAEEAFKEHERQLKFIQERLAKFCGNTQANDEKNKKNTEKDQGLYLVDGQEQGEQIEIMEEELQNLEEYIKGHEFLCNRYGLREKEADQQQKQIKKIDQDFCNKLNRKLTQNENPQTKSTPYKDEIKENQLKTVNAKNIPQESRLKKPAQMKSEQIQVSMISLGGNQVQQSSIKQEIFNSPAPKIDAAIGTEPPIPGNSKEAQFMGLLSKQKNPTFAKHKTEPHELFNSPNALMTQNHNLPNFGSISPQQQLRPQQKNRRKEILKQINDEIQSKKKQKTQKNAQKQKSRSSSDKNVLMSQDANFFKNEHPTDQQDIPIKEQRSNIHMKKQDEQKPKVPGQKQEERKAFESRPKVHRTPPKQEDQQ